MCLGLLEAGRLLLFLELLLELDGLALAEDGVEIESILGPEEVDRTLLLLTLLVLGLDLIDGEHLVRSLEVNRDHLLVCPGQRLLHVQVLQIPIHLALGLVAFHLFVVKVALSNLNRVFLDLLPLQRCGLAHSHGVLVGALGQDLRVASLREGVHDRTSPGDHADYGLGVKSFLGRFMFSEVLVAAEVHA